MPETFESPVARLRPRRRKSFQRFWNEQVAMWLLPVVVIGTGLLLFLITRQFSALYREMATQGTVLQAKTISAVRQTYSRDVVDRLGKLGIAARHDYIDHERSVPLPATLTMMIGERLAEESSGAVVRLFSEYPFPHRRNRVLDGFEQEAIVRMRVNPIETFSRFEVLDGRPVLRLAVADRMQQNCVECHNSHPESPKTDWQVGDVRGVLEVIRPLDGPVAATHAALFYTINGAVLAYGVSLLGVLLLLQRMRSTSLRLRQAEGRTRAIVSHAADGIITFDQFLRIEDFNAAAERIFGVSESEARNQSVLEYIVDTDRRLHDFVFHKLQGEDDSSSSSSSSDSSSRSGSEVQVSRKTQQIEVQGRRNDGSPFPMSLSLGAVRWVGQTRFIAIVRDLTDQKETEQALLNERSVMRELMLNLSDTVFIYFKDEQSRFLRINAALATKLGLSDPKEAIGKTDADFFPEDYARQALRDELEVMRTGRSAMNIEEHTTWPDGSQTWVSTTKMPLRDAEGRMIGTIGISRDVTDIVEAREKLRAAKEAAEASNRAKSEFLANMSHEVRTPMNGILGMTELALDTELSAEQREYLQMVQSSAQQLLQVINDILDFSKIEAGKLELNLEEFDLRDSLGDTLRALAQRADAKKLELAAHFAADVPDQLIGDRGRLRQIIVNLVGNAIKFTERGEVVLQVARSDPRDQVSRTMDVGTLRNPFDGATQSQGVSRAGDSLEPNQPSTIELHFSVRDTGIGIPSDKLECIFNEFEQADGSITRRFGGTGLGLAIARRLVDLMHGRIWVESQVGQGSTFHFTARFELPKSVEVADNKPLIVLDGLRVLVVDDNATNRRILDEMLKGWRMIPVTVASAEQALRELGEAVRNARPFSLILIDGHMPGTDGFMLAEQIRNRPELLRSTMMMLTSGGQAGDIARCQALGISAYLLKPVTQSDLFDKIIQVLSRRDSADVVSNGRASARIPSITPTSTPLRVLLAEDNHVNQRLAVSLLKKRGHQVTVANDGLEVLETLQKSTFDVILMDVQMPRMGGFEATAAIRRAEQGSPRHQPIIAMTAHAMQGDREACLAAGMDDYLSKPILPDELFRVLESFAPDREVSSPAEKTAGMGRPSNATSPVAQPPADNVPSIDIPSIDWPSAIKAADGDRELLQELIDLFVSSLPQWLSELQQAMAQENREAARRLAHTIQGSLRQLGVSSITTAQRLEAAAAAGQFAAARDHCRELEVELERVISLLKAGIPANICE